MLRTKCWKQLEYVEYWLKIWPSKWKHFKRKPLVILLWFGTSRARAKLQWYTIEIYLFGWVISQTILNKFWFWDQHLDKLQVIRFRNQSSSGISQNGFVWCHSFGTLYTANIERVVKLTFLRGDMDGKQDILSWFYWSTKEAETETVTSFVRNQNYSLILWMYTQNFKAFRIISSISIGLILTKCKVASLLWRWQRTLSSALQKNRLQIVEGLLSSVS